MVIMEMVEEGIMVAMDMAMEMMRTKTGFQKEKEKLISCFSYISLENM